ncbi:MAG TPA: ferritin [Candidatus Krumholzibacteria bacterium]|nr:ferritin [Candidatus Krumholzibacteria bacterium]HPD70753.1 ferritin [Candidatus Krumholzibacteria bacterium]HRY39547.1 ferritin [Candidatus Krumholzibacteria bacterium]
MLTERMHKALNDQLQAEFFSAYLYLAMAAYFEDQGLVGMANWMTVQFREEQLHGLKFYRYIAERGGRVELEAIGKPQRDWPSPLAAFEAALAHERMISGRINALADLSISEKDHATHAMLQWFISEQVEEEANVVALVGKLRMVGAQGPGLFMIDREMGARAFADPGRGG